MMMLFKFAIQLKTEYFKMVALCVSTNSEPSILQREDRRLHTKFIRDKKKRIINKSINQGSVSNENL